MPCTISPLRDRKAKLAAMEFEDRWLVSVGAAIQPYRSGARAPRRLCRHSDQGNVAAFGHDYRGDSRMAPSRRITSPLSMSFSMMCLTSLA